MGSVKAADSGVKSVAGVEAFLEQLGGQPVSEQSFNQYNLATAPGRICRNNLAIYLGEVYGRKPAIILLGEAPGYRGCRLTGIPFTSEHIMLTGVPELEMLGEFRGYQRSTTSERLKKEASATIVWQTLVGYRFVPLLWPAYPFHPHKPDVSDSNRRPTTAEMRSGIPFWQDLAGIMEIDQFVAIGNVAHESLAKAGIEAPKIRHPSQGGKPDFVAGIRDLARQYGLGRS